MAPKANAVELALRVAARALDAIDARWALVGGLAVGVRAEPRTTRDIDVAIAVSSDAEAERTIYALQARGYAVRTLLEHRGARRLATVRLVHRDGPQVFLDLLFASSGIEPEIEAAGAR